MDDTGTSISKTASPKRKAGLYKSIHQVIPEPRDAVVKGKIPSWVQGSLLRNGPALYEVGQAKVGSLFDGFALLHRFLIKDGKVSYQSRYLESDAYELAMAEKRIVLAGFGTAVYRDPCKSYFSHLFSYFKQPFPDATDNCNVSWLRLGRDHFYAMTENNLMHRVDPRTLKSVSKVDISKYVAVNGATAHPHIEDGVMYNLGTSYGWHTNYSIIRIPLEKEGDDTDPMENGTLLCSIPSSTFNPSYFHSFGLSRNYIVFLEQPLVANVLKLAVTRLLEKPPSSCLEFHPERKCRFYVIHRETGEVLATKYLADSFFCFHFINAYEEDGHLVVDLCRYVDGSVIQNGVELDAVRNSDVANLPETLRPVRFVLPLEIEGDQEELVTLPGTRATARLIDEQTVHCTHEDLCNKATELPRINYERHNGRPYRYFYGISVDQRQIMKVDCKSKVVVSSWEPEDDDYFPSEPVFIPKPDGEEEDDGVVLSLVCTSSGPTKNPFLVVLDAQTYTETARAEVEGEMPYGFHGLFVDELV